MASGCGGSVVIDCLIFFFICCDLIAFAFACAFVLH